MHRFGSFGYANDDEEKPEPKWWYYSQWTTWFKYTLGVTVMLVMAYNSRYPLSIIATFVILWALFALPKMAYNYFMLKKEEYSQQMKQAENRMVSESQTLSQREEEMFKKLSQQLFKD